MIIFAIMAMGPLKSNSVFKVTSATFCADIDTSFKVFNHCFDDLLPDASRFSRNVCFRFLAWARFWGINSVFQVSPKKEIWGGQVWGMRRPLNRAPAADDLISEVSLKPVESTVGCVRSSPILLEPLVSPTQSFSPKNLPEPFQHKGFLG